MSDLVTLLQASPAFFIGFVFVISLMVGSFLNVVIYRLPVMMEREWQREYQQYFQSANDSATETETFNLVKPDSTCPSCQHRIRAWENIPVLSWLWLKGRCSKCQSRISVRYPFVELSTALLSMWVAWHFGFGWQTAGALVATWMLVAMTWIDIDKMLLPDQLTLPLLWLGLLFSAGNIFTDPVSSIIGAAAGYLSLWSLYWAFKLLTGKEGMGYGDFKLLAALGAWVGWQQLPIIILLSSFVGAALGIMLILIQGKDKSQPIPFGPYLAIAGWITLLFGEQISSAYFAWMMS
ncbi:prepilin peptidase [Aestuariibacter salexigens]|uniref:prepilin peptidase n=1 Tax=Aestuariibacter salexigens TaxID=226010 RepID=UPI00041E02EF|nr:A24 family peptidase [Aestuariibacter salexigens]